MFLLLKRELQITVSFLNTGHLFIFLLQRNADVNLKFVYIVYFRVS